MITIVVLLILAGVMIAALTGENGILSRAGERNKANNIYDFVGNFYERTTETGKHKTSSEDAVSNTTYAVRCSGSFGYYGDYSASNRYGAVSTTYTYIGIGFRVALYLE